MSKKESVKNFLIVGNVPDEAVRSREDFVRDIRGIRSILVRHGFNCAYSSHTRAFLDSQCVDMDDEGASNDDYNNKFDIILCLGCPELTDYEKELKKTGAFCIYLCTYDILFTNIEIFVARKTEKASGISLASNDFDVVFYRSDLEKSKIESWFNILWGVEVYEIPFYWYYQGPNESLNPNGMIELVDKKEITLTKKRIAVLTEEGRVLNAINLLWTMAEKVYKKYKSDVGNIYFFNNTQRAKSEFLNEFVKGYHSAKDGVASVEPDGRSHEILEKYCDILLTHRGSVGIDYKVLDAFYTGKEVVHDTKLLKSRGWYFNSFDLEGGAAALGKAVVRSTKRSIEVVDPRLEWMETLHVSNSSVGLALEAVIRRACGRNIRVS